MTDVKNIGGWPKIIEGDPSRPHDVLDEFGDESDVPHDINYRAQNIYLNSKNIYVVLDTFLKFYDLGLYPPKWVLDHLVDGFRKHVKNPDPELLSTQLGVSGKGSGSTNPHDEYRWWVNREPMLEDMTVLLLGFDISLTEAARAVIAKYEPQISEKRIMAEFREHFGDKENWLRRNHPEPYDDPFQFDVENFPKEFLSEFPRKIAARIIKKRTPTKT